MWKTFVKLGFSAFGGPAAHIAMLEEEAVRKQQWLSEDEFLSLNSLTNIIPGPNSSEMVLGVGYYVNGVKGLLLAGVSFMLPSVLIVLILSMFFQSMIHHEIIQVILDGMKPVLFIMIFKVFIKFYNTGIKTSVETLLLIVGLLLLIVGVSEMGIILLFGLTYLVTYQVKNKFLVFEPISMGILFSSFLKIGATLYGSGYVLLAYLENSFLKYMSQQDIINAFLIGEITPGPVFTSATAVGVFLKGPLGGIVATLGIFIPSFILMIILMPVQVKVLKLKSVQYILKGINIASIALILKVLLNLGQSLISLEMLVILGVIVLLQWKYRLNQYQLLVVGPIISIILYFL